MDIICLKWGDKYSHIEVNRLYKMCLKYFKDDFTFTCYTENSNQINKDIKILPLKLDYDLERWWWKLTLFENKVNDMTMFLDLDVVIQNDITHYKKYYEKNKIFTIKAWWKPHARNAKPVPPGFNMDLNSSVIIWKENFNDVWEHFNDNPEYYMNKYQGIDSYLYFHHFDKLRFFPRREIYSRQHGFDEYNMWSHGKRVPLFFDETYNICIFNKWKMDKQYGGHGLPENAYEGFEKFWK